MLNFKEKKVCNENNNKDVLQEKLCKMLTTYDPKLHRREQEIEEVETDEKKQVVE
ncbi:MAG: hypothetical protein U9P70_02555 [Patescibacteria group bacterium]|nr:hypothetical protein [Patescibacteria group bacterium]